MAGNGVLGLSRAGRGELVSMSIGFYGSRETESA
jgi:hypothetical protein